ncbi:MAG: ThiF family adenylyltransferase [Peptococcaceae bacterium]|nr:ThiF family adenylyltransferase [Peptococcaceae bacterium]
MDEILENEDYRERTRLLIGMGGIKRLQRARVVVLGLGGVGSYALEALARAGVGEFWLIDGDDIELSNLNRQLLALRSTLGCAKVEAARDRVADINPGAVVRCEKMRYAAESPRDFSGWDYVVDAIDDIGAKVVLASACLKARTPLIAAMGAGRRLEAGAFRVCDVSRSSGDPLARRYRRLLRGQGITEGIKVVVSPDPPLSQVREEAGKIETGQEQRDPKQGERRGQKEQGPVGSVSFVPAVVGLLMAGEVVRDLLV